MIEQLPKVQKTHPLEHLVSYALETVISSMCTAGRLVILAFSAFRYLVLDGLRWKFQGKETLFQCWSMTNVTVIPAILVSIPIGVIVMVQVGDLIQQVGAASLAGAIGGLGIIRQAAPLVTAILLCGAAGSSIASQLGAQTIREEIDAMRVMGVNPIRHLVTPRLAAVVIVAPLLCIVVIMIIMATAYILAIVIWDATPGTYLYSFAAFASVTDIYVALGKSLFFGLIAIFIACQRGLETKNGPSGVAESVNSTVVLSVISVFIMNVVTTQIAGMYFPVKVL